MGKRAIVKWRDITFIEQSNNPLTETCVEFESMGLLLDDGQDSGIVKVASCRALQDDTYRDITLIPLSVVLDIKLLR